MTITPDDILGLIERADIDARKAVVDYSQGLTAYEWARQWNRSRSTGERLCRIAVERGIMRAGEGIRIMDHGGKRRCMVYRPVDPDWKPPEVA